MRPRNVVETGCTFNVTVADCVSGTPWTVADPLMVRVEVPVAWVAGAVIFSEEVCPAVIC